VLAQGLGEAQASRNAIPEIGDHGPHLRPVRLPLQDVQAHVERVPGLDQQRQALREEDAVLARDRLRTDRDLGPGARLGGGADRGGGGLQLDRHG
jgi:hypothetical protein